MRYTVVEHSAAYAKPEFTKGLESKAVYNESQAQRIIKMGGLVFDSYTEAEDFIDTESYPKGYTGLNPQAPGSFSSTAVGGRRLYIPVRANA